MNKALQELQSGRDPFAASRNEIQIAVEPRQPFCYRAAFWSVWLPTIAGLLTYGINSALEGVTGTAGMWGRIAALLVFCVLVLASLFLGIIALCAVREYGPDGLLFRGIKGVCVSLIIMGFFTSTTIRVVRMAIENRKALLALRATTVRARTDTEAVPKDKPEEKRPPAPQPQPVAPVNQVPDPSLGIAPVAAPGDALVTKATDSYVQKLKSLVTNYTRAFQALQDPPVLNMSAIARHEQLGAKKDLVKKFLAANEKLEAFVVNSEDLYRKELESIHCPQGTVETTIEAYRHSAQEKNFLTLKIRDADQRKASAILGMLEVLDSSWGEWRYDQETKRVLFTASGALHSYLTYRDAMDSAAADQKRLQTQLTPLASL